MQFKFLPAAAALVLFPILAAALPGGVAPPTTTAPATPPTSSCDTGSIQCCNSVQDANSSAVTTLATLLGIVLGPITGQVGLTCSPLSVVGLGQNSCTAQPVCCTGNNFSGLIVVGCSPIAL